MNRPPRQSTPDAGNELQELQTRKAQLEVALLEQQLAAAGGTLPPDKRRERGAALASADAEKLLRSLEKRLNIKPNQDPKTGVIAAKESQVATAGTAATVKSGNRGPVPLPTGGGMRRDYNPVPVGTQLREGIKSVTVTPAGVQVPRKVEQTQQTTDMHEAFWNGLSDDAKQAWQKNETSWAEKRKLQQVHAAEFLNKPELDPRSQLERAAAGGSLGFAWSEEAGAPERPVVSDPQPAKGPGHTWGADSMKIDTGAPRPSLKNRFMARRDLRVAQPALNTPKIESLDLTMGRTFENPVRPVVAPEVLIAPETEPVEPQLNTPTINKLDLTRDPKMPRPQAPAKEPTPLELAAQQGALHWSEEHQPPRAS